MTTKHDYQAAQRWIDTGPNAPKHYTKAGNEKNREAIRHALATMQRMRWQPIEMAPRDGTLILLYGFVRGNGLKVMQGYWHQPGNPSMKGFWIPNIFCNLRVRNPTHWMPLPPAPGVTGGDDEFR